MQTITTAQFANAIGVKAEVVREFLKNDTPVAVIPYGRGKTELWGNDLLLRAAEVKEFAKERKKAIRAQALSNLEKARVAQAQKTTDRFAALEHRIAVLETALRVGQH